MRPLEETKGTLEDHGVDGVGEDDFSLGLAFYRTNMLDEAIERFNKSVESPETLESSLFYLGMIYFRKEEFSKATHHFKALLEKNPENIVAYNNLGVSLENEGLAKEAELVYREAQKISPLASQVLTNIGILLYRMGDFSQAREYLERAVHLNRGMAFAFFYLGMTYFRLSQWDEAEEYLEKSLALSPDNAVLCNNLGTIYKRAGNFHKALEYFLRALEVDKELPHPYANIDDIFCVVGEWGECQMLLDEAIPDPTRRVMLLGCLGGYYYSKGMTDLAQQMWHKALEIDPDNAEIRNRIEGFESRESES